MSTYVIALGPYDSIVIVLDHCDSIVISIGPCELVYVYNLSTFVLFGTNKNNAGYII